MTTVHVWSCGQCGAHVRASVGTIAQAFAAHAAQCPALRRPRLRRAAARRGAGLPTSTPRPRPTPTTPQSKGA
jgi:hypothetical protein